jgi:hypothetical protein
MNNKIIKLVIHDRTASGYNHATLFLGEDASDLSDCGALYLSDAETANLTDVLQHGVASCNADASDKFVFELDDKTRDLANEY